MYTAIVLEEKSRNLLIKKFNSIWENNPNFEIIAHHCTLNMGKTSNEQKELLGTKIKLKVVSFSFDEKVAAVQVEISIKTVNKIPHITLGVDRSVGGKPVMSNQLTNWKTVKPFYLIGIVKEVN